MTIELASIIEHESGEDSYENEGDYPDRDTAIRAAIRMGLARIALADEGAGHYSEFLWIEWPHGEGVGEPRLLISETGERGSYQEYRLD